MTVKEVLGEVSHPESGRVERPMTARPWRAYEVRLDGDRLRWRVKPGTVVPPTGELLAAFVRLSEGSDGTILRFAKRWGPLGLCVHGFPAGHPASYWPTRAAEAHPCPHNQTVVDVHQCTPRGTHEDEQWEPLSEWRAWAARAKAILECVARLQEDRVPSESAQRLAFDIAPDYEALPPTRTASQVKVALATAKSELTYYLNAWLRAASVRPFVESAPRITVTWGSSANPVFGALAIQLMLVATGAWGLAVCNGCGDTYMPSRQPKPHTRHYCPTCNEDGVPLRDAARAYRARQRTPSKRRLR